MLTPYGKREWSLILLLSAILFAGAIFMQWWVFSGIIVVACLCLLSFFRDPHRSIPSKRGVMVSPADGRVSSIHEVEFYEPLGEPATCVRIFLSVLNVHVNRSPCHAAVHSITHKPGQFMNALNPASADVNESTTIVLNHPIKKHHIAAVRQVSGAIARRIVTACKVGQILQRGERMGMIKFGSTTELYVPRSALPQVRVRLGEKVTGGQTILMQVSPTHGSDVQTIAEPAKSQVPA